jgi:hypothetical protein
MSKDSKGKEEPLVDIDLKPQQRATGYIDLSQILANREAEDKSLTSATNNASYDGVTIDLTPRTTTSENSVKQNLDLTARSTSADPFPANSKDQVKKNTPVNGIKNLENILTAQLEAKNTLADKLKALRAKREETAKNSPISLDAAAVIKKIKKEHESVKNKDEREANEAKDLISAIKQPPKVEYKELNSIEGQKEKIEKSTSKVNTQPDRSIAGREAQIKELKESTKKLDLKTFNGNIQRMDISRQIIGHQVVIAGKSLANSLADKMRWALGSKSNKVSAPDGPSKANVSKGANR